MKITKRRVLTAAVTTASAGLVAGSLAVAPTLTSTSAAAPVAAAAPAGPGEVSTTLAKQLGARTAGSYLKGGKLVVTVTDAEAARTVRAAGAEPRTVSRNGSYLKKVMASLKRDATIPGTAWAVDAASNQVLLTMDSTVTGAKLNKVKAAAAKHGAAVRTERVPGTFRPFTLGGDPILTGGSRCTLGFNVRQGTTYYFLTAGHCTMVGATWTDASGRALGTRQATSFPGDDYGLVRYGPPPEDTAGGVRAYGQFRDITAAGQPSVGQDVLFTGGATGTHEGKIVAVGQTVNYPQGTVTGLIRCSVCAGPGDSGGPVFAGSTALGILSGGNTGCSGGAGVTFYQPVLEPLQSLGVDIY